jgi:hypothetical protein
MTNPEGPFMSFSFNRPSFSQALRKEVSDLWVEFLMSTGVDVGDALYGREGRMWAEYSVVEGIGKDEGGRDDRVVAME